MFKLKLFFVLSFVFLTGVTSAQKQYATCSKDGKLYGYIDQDGNEVIPFKYIYPTAVSSAGVFCAMDPSTKKRALFSIKGEEIPTPFQGFDLPDVMGFNEKGFVLENIRIIYKGKYGVLDKQGKAIHQPEYDRMTDFFDDFTFGGKGTKWYILKMDGSKVPVNTEAKEIKRFKEGLAPFVTPKGLCGFVNEKGEVVVEPKYLNVGYFSLGLAWVRLENKKIGFIDKTGKMIIEPKYDVVKEFDEVGKCAMAKIGSQFYILKSDGSEISVEGVNALKDFNEGIAEAKKGDKWGYVDGNGKWLVQPIYNKNNKFEYGYGRIFSGVKWGAVNTKGDIVIQPKYHRLHVLENGLFSFKESEEGKFGIVNSKGEVVVNPSYDDIKDFKDGFARVKLGDKWGMINRQGKLVIPIQYVRMSDFSSK